ncbi:MAG: hypothetical protein HUU23_09085 [Caldilineales bacterium]|nr:hypothetical protein [Caldilineales bacterium]
MFDLSFLFTILLVFLVGLVGAWLRSRRRDPCLASFEGYHVTLELADGRLIWGVLDVTPTGLELHYRQAVHDDQHVESSFILYGSEYAGIQAIYRYADELEPEKQAEREIAIARAFHPAPPRFLARKLRNFLATAGESFNEVLGLVIGRVKKPAGRYITDASETQLRQLGSNVIGHVGGPHDPLLERFIGSKVVLEVSEEGERHEHVGIFKNYSPDFIEVLDVQFPYRLDLAVDPGEVAERPWVTAAVRDGAVEITNRSEQPILIMGLDIGEGQEPLNIVLDKGVAIPIFPGKPVESARVFCRIIRELDMVMPRTRCQVRHRAEREASGPITDIIFDMGMMLQPSKREQIMETRLRKRLKLNPLDATAAANLGALLLKRNQLDEATQWLQQAQKLRNSLFDHGAGVDLQLRELQRRRRHHLPGAGGSKAGPEGDEMEIEATIPAEKAD